MSSLQPVSVVSDPGDSDYYAPDEHSHQLFDQGTVLVLESGFTQFSADPLRIYTAANWYYLTGSVTRTGATTGARIAVATVPEQKMPSAPSNRLFKDSQVSIRPVELLPSGDVGLWFCQIMGSTNLIEFVLGATNGVRYIFSSDWRGR